MALTAVSTGALRAELARRDRIEEEERAEAMRKWVRSEYGVCKAEYGVTAHPFTIRSGEPFLKGPCGEEFCGYEVREVREIRQAPDDWPALLPCPPERCWIVGAEVETKLTCPRGHETFFERTVSRAEPIKPFGFGG